MLRAVASNGQSIVVADGDVGAAVSPDGTFLVALLGSLMAMSDWHPYDGPVPHVPQAALDQIEAMKQGGLS